MEQINFEKLTKKWAPILEAKGVPAFSDNYRRNVTAALLENQERNLQEERQQGNQLLMETPTNAIGGSELGGAGNIAHWDPVLISMVRRSTPNMMAFDLMGVQPMSGPVGLIFCMKSRYVDGSPRDLSTSSEEALFNEADTTFSGKGTQGGDSSSLPSADNVYSTDSPEGWSNSDDADLNGLNDAFGVGTGVSTSTAESMTGDSSAQGSDNYIEEMGFTIEKTSATAESHALRATYSVEMMQDLKAVHGLDAESELANILTTEMMTEKDRIIVRTINQKAKLGAQQAGLTSVANGGPGGVFDLATDADGRWSVEKYRGLLMQLEREANVIAKETRRGRGNVVLCSSDVASALNAAGILDYGTNGTNGLQVDDTGSTFAGTLFNRMRVYIDPYATVNYITIGYKGASPMDNGLFYCPYIPLTPYRTIGEKTYQPSIAFKERYTFVANPFAEATPQSGRGTNRANTYYRIMAVKNILS